MLCFVTDMTRTILACNVTPTLVVTLRLYLAVSAVTTVYVQYGIEKQYSVHNSVQFVYNDNMGACVFNDKITHY